MPPTPAILAAPPSADGGAVLGAGLALLLSVDALLLWRSARRARRSRAGAAPTWGLTDLWFVLQMVVVLLVALLVPLVAALALLPGVRIDWTRPDVLSRDMLLGFVLPGTVLQNAAFFLVPAAFVALRYRMPLRDIGLPPLPRPRDLAAGVTLGLLFAALSGAAGAALTGFASLFRDVPAVAAMLRYEETNPVAQLTGQLAALGPAGLAATVLAVGLAAPVGEEMLFRGFAQNALSARLGPRAGLVLQAALFSAPHTYSPIGLLVVFGVGLALGWVYRTSGSLWTAIAAHATNNTLLVALAYFLPHLAV